MLNTMTEQLRRRENLTEPQVLDAISQLTAESVSADAKADFLSALAQKGETTAEIAAFAKNLRELSIQPPLDAETRARTMAEMMVKLACMKAEQVFSGPKVPVHYVFPEPGVYHLFFELAPGGVTRVFHFALAVETYRAGMDTELRSMVAPALPQP